MEATAPAVTENKSTTTTETTQDVDHVQEDVQARVSKPLVCSDVNIKRRGITKRLSI